jgi:prolyl 4-hydroxylase
MLVCRRRFSRVRKAIIGAMLTVPAPPPIPRLPPEWQDWLAGNVVRGCTDADLLATMQASGFQTDYARVAIAVVRSMTERVQREAPAMLVSYAADPIRLQSTNRLTVADREAGLGFMLADPNVALVHDLLSEQECAQLIALAAGKLSRSQVVDRVTGAEQVSAVRTSAGAYFERGENALVARIEQRIAALTGLPVEHGEPLQMLRYLPGNEYLAHHDYFDPADSGTADIVRFGGQRVATLIMYLNDVVDGGETRFPELSLAVKPRRGSAVYFEYHNQAGELDSRCLHAGTPVIQGEKWIATKWLRLGPYQR